MLFKRRAIFFFFEMPFYDLKVEASMKLLCFYRICNGECFVFLTAFVMGTFMFSEQPFFDNSQETLICLKSATETLEECVKYVQS